MLKRCYRCKEKKSLDAFSKDKSREDGLQPRCIACNRALYKANKESISMAKKAHYAANSSRIKASTKVWYEDNRERMAASNKTWAKAHPEKVRAYKKKYSDANKEKKAASSKAWEAANRGKSNAKAAKRRALKKQASVELTPEELQFIEDMYIMCRSISEVTGVVHHVDHIKPISKGGKHHPDNLQILTATENLQKHAKWEGD